MSDIKKLQKEIEEKQALLEKLQKQEVENKPIIKLEDYSNADKIAYFDRLYKFANSILNKAENGERHDDNDDEHWAYEEVMLILNINNNRDFWKYFNTLI